MMAEGNNTPDSGSPPLPEANDDRPGSDLGRLLRLALVLVVLLAAAVGGWLYSYAVTPADPGDHAGRTVLIPPGTGLPGIQRLLAGQGLIVDDIRFRILARLLGMERRLQAGEYHLAAKLSPVEILRELESGRIVLRSVTIPEGSNLSEVANILAADGWVSREDFLHLASDPVFIHDDLRLDVSSLEGYLFPDTYYLSRGQDDRAIIRMLVARLQKLLAELGLDAPGVEVHGLNLHQVLTLASIVEKETAVPAERSLIARVFLNRLGRGMRLQTDPTVIYGIADFDGNLTRKDLKTPSPYNTYLIRGLPPGPIANPGRAAIEAVLSPAEGDFLYFVSRNDGTHYFSRTLAEHNRAVTRFQKSLRRRR